ncbi:MULTISPECIES: RagB/SusD family nutrient uptake outer membrane protein [Sphingobacterium]|uniref:RagB/SusD family nutrient uptake outer membrane protein n=1 Tax=Sphingobacterium TaxID=28453 RepID=UPI0025800F70|nr:MULTISPECIES: RagB/SusD family nutrient uptake outer membrane protein [Sphingobacterium]
MKNVIKVVLLSIILAMTCISCEKFLDAKSNSSINVPSTIKDLRAILDYDIEINNFYPAQLEIAADDFLITDDGYWSFYQEGQDCYTWNDQGIQGGWWSMPYKVISNANVILEGLERITTGNQVERRSIEGEALFLRGWALFYLAQTYCQPFTFSDIGDGLGMVILKNSSAVIHEKRASLKQTYDQIIEDLTKATALLPETQEFVTRPSRNAAYAALARIYLVIGNYEQAELMVDQVFKTQSSLLNYTGLDPMASLPFNINNNREIIYTGASGSSSFFILDANVYVNEELYKMYGDGDLRKEIFFEKDKLGYKFKGFQNGVRSGYYGGLMMDELYLIKAECLARKNRITEGLFYLNKLLSNRFDKLKFEPLMADSEKELLEKVLVERRKELVCRGQRWLDLRRLNKEGTWNVSLSRVINDGKERYEFILPPNDLRYTFLVPQKAMLDNKYIQNPR